MGRVKLDVKRDTIIPFRVTPEESNELARVCKKVGVKKADIIRFGFLETIKAICEIKSSDIKEVMMKQKKFTGSFNIHQICKMYEDKLEKKLNIKAYQEAKKIVDDKKK